jgi:hypothetical protein
MSEQSIQCQRCGHQNLLESRFCNRCGTALVSQAVQTAVPMQNQSASSRSIIALVLGILAIFMLGFLSGIPAMILAKNEEDEIRKGNSPVAGEMLAKLGFWLGLIGTILSGLALLFIILIVFSAMSLPFLVGCSI